MRLRVNQFPPRRRRRFCERMIQLKQSRLRRLHCWRALVCAPWLVPGSACSVGVEQNACPTALATATNQGLSEVLSPHCDRERRLIASSASPTGAAPNLWRARFPQAALALSPRRKTTARFRLAFVSHVPQRVVGPVAAVGVRQEGTWLPKGCKTLLKSRRTLQRLHTSPFRNVSVMEHSWSRCLHIVFTVRLLSTWVIGAGTGAGLAGVLRLLVAEAAGRTTSRITSTAEMEAMVRWGFGAWLAGETSRWSCRFFKERTFSPVQSFYYRHTHLASTLCDGWGLCVDLLRQELILRSEK